MKGEWDGIPVQPGAKGKINAKLLTKGLRGKVRTDSKDPRDAMQGLFAIVENTKTEGAQP
jgi:hypothetical protein